MRVVLYQTVRRSSPLDRWNGSTRRQWNGALNVRTSHYRAVKTEREVDLSLLDPAEIAVLEAIRVGGKYEGVQWFGLRSTDSVERVRPPEFTPEADALPLHRWLRQFVDLLRLRHGVTAIRAQSWTTNYDWIEL